jgi:hypothetical protein
VKHGVSTAQGRDLEETIASNVAKKVGDIAEDMRRNAPKGEIDGLWKHFDH